MANKIQLRRDTAYNWSHTNPVLSSGEFGFEIDTGKLKIGNGSTDWATLTYFAGSGGTASISSGDTPPSSPSENQLWFDTVGGRMYVYFSNTWVDTNPETGGSGVFSGNTPPPSPSENQLWFDTTHNRLYIYYSSNWINTSPENVVSLRYGLESNLIMADQTAIQSLFGVGVNLQSTTRYEYVITGIVYSEAISPTILKYALDGTAILAGHSFTVLCSESLDQNNSFGSLTNQPALSSVTLDANYNTPVDISSGAVTGNTYYNFVISGVIDVTTSGTVNPQIAFDNSPGNGSIMTGTRIELKPVGATGVNTSVGTWTA